MTLNFQQLLAKIKQIGMEAQKRKKELDSLHLHARKLLDEWSDKSEELRSKVERARRFDPTLRCALPQKELLNSFFEPPSTNLDAMENSITLLAADGSQILPDRHSSFNYSLVNVGAISLRTGSGDTPQVSTDTTLLYGEDLYTDTGLVNAEMIELQRDLAERQKLLELSSSLPAPIVALTDGPVELWGTRDAPEAEYHQKLEAHKEILSRLMEKRIITAGYVDNPSADLVVRTLEIGSLTTDEEFNAVRIQHPLRGVTDRGLFNYLPPGSRSAVMMLQSGSRQYYTGNLALHFFYLNIGYAKHYSFARVEFPQWVAQNPDSINLLHVALLHQCRMMGARPYPYMLHRAHELAVVKLEEKQHVEHLLDLELRHAGIEIEEPSAKQSSKELETRH